MLYHVQSIAIQFYLESNIKKFPVDPLKVRCSSVKWKVLHYDSNTAHAILESLNMPHLPAVLQEGFTVTTPSGDYIIFYNPKLSYTDRCYCIAHEIGHIILGHSVSNYVAGKSDSHLTDNRQEQEANEFARYLLAPECILRNMNVVVPEDISKHTGLSHEHALQTAYGLSKNLKFIPSEIELVRKFNSNRRYTQRYLNRVTIGVTAFILLCALIISVLQNESARDSIMLQTKSTNDAEFAINNDSSQKTYFSNYVYAISYNHKYHKESCYHISHVEPSKLMKINAVDAVKEFGQNGACKSCRPLED